MRRQRARAFRRGWVGLAILSLGGIACLAGGWSNGPELQAEDRGPAPSEIVAARFALATVASPEIPVAATVVGKRQLGLFDPTPLVPLPPAAPAAVNPLAAPAAAMPQAAPIPVAAPTPPPAVHHHAPKPPAAHVQRAANRPGYVLNEAQIASIKRRLNLTPDQERMWPAVEGALRNIAYVKSPGRSHPARTQSASVDPNSPEVQGLKSAAFPLLMSFSAEQKNEVRTLVHLMGLDQLAQQF